MPTGPSRKPYVSLGFKLTIPLVLVVAAAAIGAYLGLVRMARSNLFDSKVAAATMVTKLFAASVSPAVVFDDDTAMQRSVDDLARNEEVADVEVWAAPKPDAARSPAEPAAPQLAGFHRGGASGPLAGGTHVERAERTERIERDDTKVDVIEPILDPQGGVVAVARVRFTLERERAALARLARQSLFVSIAVATAFALAMLLMLARVVVMPLARLERAARSLAGGGSAGSERTVALFDDEVGRLTTTFASMAEAVVDRERRLADRNGELKLILDNVSQGFLMALPDGTLREERSAIVGAWLGALPTRATFGDVIGRLDPNARALAELGFLQLVDGALPLDVAVGQLPRSIRRDERHFELAYHPVVRGEELERVVIVLSDVTAEVERRRVEEDQREFAALVTHLVHDRRGFLEFWRESTALVASLACPTADASLRRDLHTLKGNARFFGMSRLSALCHALESAVAEAERPTLRAPERERLQAEWTATGDRLATLTEDGTAFVELTEADHARLTAAIVEHAPYDALAQLVAGYRFEPTRRSLERARQIVEATCRKLGKPLPIVHVRDDGLRLPPGRWSAFWSTFSHVLVNAADHGLETESERVDAAKPGPGNLWLTTSLEADELVVSVRDDGRGIDWERVRAKATERGVAHETQEQLEAALLAEGVSTKSAVADVSGRGVGLAAVAEAVAAMHGRIELESAYGVGTTWRFRFPSETLLEAHAPVS